MEVKEKLEKEKQARNEIHDKKRGISTQTDSVALKRFAKKPKM